MSIVQKLTDKGLIYPPPFVAGSVQYEVLMGSEAYGVSSADSDRDVYGFCMPPKSMVFPHLSGEIFGFGQQIKRFEQYQQHHIQDPDALGGKGVEYDFSIYSIVKYFQLCMDNNPNMLDSLFVPDRCVLSITRIGNILRDNRKKFLHKGAWPRYKGYSFSQLHKMRNKSHKGKRKKDVEKFGFDLKYAYHIVRLLNFVEQILIEGDLTLDRNREQLKAIRRGEWTLEQVESYFTQKEKSLEDVYNKSTLPWGPDEKEIKKILLYCLEEYYGDLHSCVVMPEVERETLRRIDELLGQVRHLL